MQYTSFSGEHIKVHTPHYEVTSYIACPDLVHMSKRLYALYSDLLAELQIKDGVAYLINALNRGNCVIVVRDENTLLVACHKLDYIIDSDLVEILSMYRH